MLLNCFLIALIFGILFANLSVQQCFYSEKCYSINDNGMSYRGKLNTTEENKPCLDWTKHKYDVTPTKYPDAGLTNNYCRNPRGSGPKPWCYTAPDESGKYWGFCKIEQCDKCLFRGIYMKEGDVFHNGCAQGICTGAGITWLTCPGYNTQRNVTFGCYLKQQDANGRYPLCCSRVVCRSGSHSDPDWNWDEYMSYVKNQNTAN